VDYITIRGAREHNLREVDLDIPRERLVVVTGVSGSGKSSLAFDTIYAEGQRRYVESLSSYARQFLGQMEKPDVDMIDGLSPAIAIEQKSLGSNPRSTVATATEIYDYLRLLYARVGVQHCHICGRVIRSQTVSGMADRLLKLGAGTRVAVLAPLVKGRKGEFKAELESLRKRGFLRIRADGKAYDISEGPPRLARNVKHDIDVYVDRLTLGAGASRRAIEALEAALELSGGTAVAAPERGEEILFSERAACVKCGVSYEELLPRSFSFSSPYGACRRCGGLGTALEIEEELVVPDPSLSISEGALVPWGPPSGKLLGSRLRSLARDLGFDLGTPFGKLSASVRRVVLHGGASGGRARRGGRGRGQAGASARVRSYEGVIPTLQRRFDETKSEAVRRWISNFMAPRPCGACGGARLRPESLAVKVGGKAINEVTALSVEDCSALFAALEFDGREGAIAGPIVKEVADRVAFMGEVGLGYLTLDRPVATLAGGEAQRIKLATQIGSRLTGVLYILDEPTVGLHHKDTGRLLSTLAKLRDMGNSVIVVEHDRQTIETSDYVIDLGPGAGVNGGRVVAAGAVDEIKRCKASLTGLYLEGAKRIPLPERRRPTAGAAIEVLGAKQHNLKGIDVSFPLGALICVTGVSGSGKSTLVNDVLYAALAKRLYRSTTIPGAHKGLRGVSRIDKVVDVDQSPIGRTPRSNAATYTGAFTPIRQLFSQTAEARVRGYKPGRFSFNVKGGRCEACRGEGMVKIEMHFLPDVYVRCDRCGGRRYNDETLEITYKGVDIAGVLDMTVDEACRFLAAIPVARRRLEVLRDVGLGYIRLGQPATTLSGGEAQRVKLSAELAKVATGNTLYILDEPTTGLHFEDVNCLLGVLGRLVDRGNTVIVIEHNPDVIKTADHIVDLGPEGGEGGGRVVASGTPEEVAACPGSYTGVMLRSLLRAERSGRLRAAC
jgi:excinuclease ABC subunit A